jgi:hypothetical protein
MSEEVLIEDSATGNAFEQTRAVKGLDIPEHGTDKMVKQTTPDYSVSGRSVSDHESTTPVCPSASIDKRGIHTDPAEDRTTHESARVAGVDDGVADSHSSMLDIPFKEPTYDEDDDGNAAEEAFDDLTDERAKMIASGLHRMAQNAEAGNLDNMTDELDAHGIVTQSMSQTLENSKRWEHIDKLKGLTDRIFGLDNDNRKKSRPVFMRSSFAREPSKSFSLKPYQWVIITFELLTEYRYGAVLNGCHMGTGKTIQVLCYCSMRHAIAKMTRHFNSDANMHVLDADGKCKFAASARGQWWPFAVCVCETGCPDFIHRHKVPPTGMFSIIVYGNTINSYQETLNDLFRDSTLAGTDDFVLPVVFLANVPSFKNMVNNHPSKLPIVNTLGFRRGKEPDMDFTRYLCIFTHQSFPNGRLVDATLRKVPRTKRVKVGKRWQDQTIMDVDRAMEIYTLAMGVIAVDEFHLNRKQTGVLWQFIDKIVAKSSCRTTLMVMSGTPADGGIADLVCPISIWRKTWGSIVAAWNYKAEFESWKRREEAILQKSKLKLSASQRQADDQENSEDENSDNDVQEQPPNPLGIEKARWLGGFTYNTVLEIQALRKTVKAKTVATYEKTYSKFIRDSAIDLDNLEDRAEAERRQARQGKLFAQIQKDTDAWADRLAPIWISHGSNTMCHGEPIEQLPELIKEFRSINISRPQDIKILYNARERIDRKVVECSRMLDPNKGAWALMAYVRENRPVAAFPY